MASTATGNIDKAAAVQPAISSHHHLAFRCHDPEQTRAFYEDFLGLEFTAAIPSETTVDGKPVKSLKLMFRMAGGDFLEFTHVPGDSNPEIFAPLGPFEVHLALKLGSEQELLHAQEYLKQAGIEYLGPMDHEFVKSVYFPDPNGIFLEYTYEVPEHEEIMSDLTSHAQESMEEWAEISAPAKNAAWERINKANQGVAGAKA